MKRFRDQGEAMVSLANNLLISLRREEAIKCFHQALTIGRKHLSFSVEFLASMQLGQMACDDGRFEEGLELLRSALVYPTPYTPNHQPSTLHPTPYTLHPTPYTLHPTPYTLHPTPYTLNPQP
ncbi:hypothetical protein T484DRAFT_3569851 [Baffinella frigidus]|nr:hypothetical protein T484DRAFT_3569851 [Cryptophyta sp. CCMP2293]